jgi:hypothetical protein
MRLERMVGKNQTSLPCSLSLSPETFTYFVIVGMQQSDIYGVIGVSEQEAFHKLEALPRADMEGNLVTLQFSFGCFLDLSYTKFGFFCLCVQESKLCYVS